MDRQSLCIKRWAAWIPGVHSREEWLAWQRGERDISPDQGPDLKQIPPMLRRRLSSLGKMALSVAWELLPEETLKMPAVFASRHGELERTVGMLQSLAQGEALSPTQFSLSVHNAVSGVFSIARQDTHPITALAINEEGPSLALLEAALILGEGPAEQVLCVIYDEPLPEPYASGNPEQGPALPFAAAFVLAAPEAATGDDVVLDLSLVSAGNTVSVEGEPAMLSFLRYLLDPAQAELCLPGYQHQWAWSRKRAA